MPRMRSGTELSQFLRVFTTYSFKFIFTSDRKAYGNYILLLAVISSSGGWRFFFLVCKILFKM